MGRDAINAHRPTQNSRIMPISPVYQPRGGVLRHYFAIYFMIGMSELPGIQPFRGLDKNWQKAGNRPFSPSESLLAPTTDPKHMPIRMPQVHFANAPRHARRRKRDVQPGRHTLRMNRVHVLHPNRHPYSVVGCFVAAGTKRGSVRAAATAPLPALTEKNFTHARPHPAKPRRRPPIPKLFPPPLLKPSKAS